MRPLLCVDCCLRVCVLLLVERCFLFVARRVWLVAGCLSCLSVVVCLLLLRLSCVV